MCRLLALLSIGFKLLVTSGKQLAAGYLIAYARICVLKITKRKLAKAITKGIGAVSRSKVFFVCFRNFSARFYAYVGHLTKHEHAGSQDSSAFCIAKADSLDASDSAKGSKAQVA